MKTAIICLAFTLLLGCKSIRSTKDDAPWIQLFNGKDLTGWDLKITGHPLNENYMDIFSVKDSILKVSYNNLDSFRGEFGHIFYKQKYSSYRLRIEYRFTDSQCPGGPDWGLRNSGVMVHSQSAESMGLDQDFPVSIEVQFLGGLGTGERSTLNVCTPGTDIDIDGQPIQDHCTNSDSKTYDGDQWVTAEITVFEDSLFHHVIDGDTVITYSNSRIGPDMKPDGYVVPDGTPLKEGYIALQAESHNVEFRKVELQDLSERK